MSIRRAQASVLSGINNADTGFTDGRNYLNDHSYKKVSAGYIPTFTGSVVPLTTTTTYNRPSNVHFLDIFLVGGGGGGGGGSSSNGGRRGGGGGGGAVVQVNKFYIGDYNTWHFIIGAGGGSEASNSGCCCNAWGFNGMPTFFTPLTNVFSDDTKTNLVGIDNTDLRRSLVAPGGGGGGHPCGSSGFWTATAGGQGSNRAEQFLYGLIIGSDPHTNNARQQYTGFGGRGGQDSGGVGGTGGAGGGAGVGTTNQTGGAGRNLLSPFSGAYGGGGAGGNGTGATAFGGAASGSAGATNTGGGGSGRPGGANAAGLAGGSGRAGYREHYSL